MKIIFIARFCFLSLIICLFNNFYAITAQTAINEKIVSAYDPVTGCWDIAWPGKISQYDLVYLSPPVDPLQGIPLGNGDIGVLFWCENSKIIAVVNKSDLWDDASFGPFHNWSREEEDYSTTQRHAIRIIVDFKYPVFNTLYLTDFTAKLNLASPNPDMLPRPISPAPPRPRPSPPKPPGPKPPAPAPPPKPPAPNPAAESSAEPTRTRMRPSRNPSAAAEPTAAEPAAAEPAAARPAAEPAAARPAAEPAARPASAAVHPSPTQSSSEAAAPLPSTSAAEAAAPAICRRQHQDREAKRTEQESPNHD